MEDGAEVAPSARGSRDKYSNERYDWRKKMGKNFLEEQVEEKEREVENEEEEEEEEEEVVVEEAALSEVGGG